MSRRIALPGADELFRTTTLPKPAEEPVQAESEEIRQVQPRRLACALLAMENRMRTVWSEFLTTCISSKD